MSKFEYLYSEANKFIIGKSKADCLAFLSSIYADKILMQEEWQLRKNSV